MKKELFTIKNFKTWNTYDGGGYQFTLYYDGKKFAQVHNDGNGGWVNVDCFEKENQIRFDTFIDNLPKWKSSIDGSDMNMTSDIFMDELVNEFEMAKKLAKAKKKGTTFRLLTDVKNMFRTLNVLDLTQARAYLDQHFPNNYVLI
jgi:hypothetical protein